LRRVGQSKSFSRLAIPTRRQFGMRCSFNELRMAWRMLLLLPDEVARNGALERMTSARGFPECPLLFSQSLFP
jgi:hypothetical protein